MTGLDGMEDDMLAAELYLAKVERAMTAWGHLPEPSRLQRVARFLYAPRLSLVEGLGIGCTFGLGVWWLT